MENTGGAGGARLANHGPGVILGVASVNDQGLVDFRRESNLRRERGTLRLPRRIVVMVVEAALPYRDSGIAKQLAQARYVTLGKESCRVVWMDAGGREYKPGMLGRVLSRARRCGERFTDANYRQRARFAGAIYYRVAVAAERRVREVGVTVDED